MNSIMINYNFEDFEKDIDILIDLERRRRYMEKVTDSDVEDPLIDRYISHIANLFSGCWPDYGQDYGEAFYDYWTNWAEMVESAITGFVYGVIDVETRKVVAPTAHTLLYITSVDDPTYKNNDKYLVPMDSIEDLWHICTGSILVRERFS